MISFTKHAILKLKQRSIARGLVVKTLKNPDKILPTNGGKMIAFKKFRNLYLKVIFVNNNNKIIVVITQHWVSKI